MHVHLRCMDITQLLHSHKHNAYWNTVLDNFWACYYFKIFTLFLSTKCVPFKARNASKRKEDTDLQLTNRKSPACKVKKQFCFNYTFDSTKNWFGTCLSSHKNLPKSQGQRLTEPALEIMGLKVETVFFGGGPPPSQLWEASESSSPHRPCTAGLRWFWKQFVGAFLSWPSEVRGWGLPEAPSSRARDALGLWAILSVFKHTHKLDPHFMHLMDSVSRGGVLWCNLNFFFKMMLSALHQPRWGRQLQGLQSAGPQHDCTGCFGPESWEAGSIASSWSLET